MDIHGRTILILGGSGLVGMAVARRLLADRPKSLILSALTRQEAEAGVRELRAEDLVGGGTSIEAEWGDILVPEAMKDRRRDEVLADPSARSALLDDLFGEMTEDVVRRSTLGSLLLRHQPELIVDCVNTATAFAYQDVFESAGRLRMEARAAGAGIDEVERHLATLSLPQLIRHVQIVLEAMRRARTRFYLRVGTSGTGGMGLNIPFTHSEQRPSPVLLAKAGIAGAHTLLLYLMARTPDSPAVKEIKPTAAISWKRIGVGPVHRRGRPVERYDAVRPIAIGEAFGEGVREAYRLAGGHLEGVYLDAGENGLFSRGEFEVLSALGLMEYITPEEIAENVEREIRGYPTGRDVVAALDAATSGPTYRAGVLRVKALERMAALEREHGVEAVAYEMLGPPRLSKLLFEGTLLARLFATLGSVAELDPDSTAQSAAALIEADADLRVRILSIGLPILLPDGLRLLRGPEVKVAPSAGGADADRLADSGWVDLRPGNWSRWAARTKTIVAELRGGGGLDEGSRVDTDPADIDRAVQAGRLAAWVFRREDRGERVKR